MPLISLKFDVWPDADRALWHRITTQGCPLDDQGAGANWAAETKRVIARDYGYWLSFVLALEPAAGNERPTARVTPERIRQYCQSMGDVCALTRVSRVARLQNVVRAADPAHDWEWLSGMRRALEKSARRNGPVRKKHGRIIDAGISLLQKAHTDDGRRIAIRAKDFRDGLMLALLAARPLRLKNFTALRLGLHLRSTSNGYLIDIPGNETKTGSPIETFVPERLCPWFALYLETYRPVLLKDRLSDYLWVHPNGACYQPGALSMRISQLTAPSLRSVVEKQAAHHRPMEQSLSLQKRGIGQGPLHDYAPVSDDGHLIGEVGNIHFDTGRMHANDLFQPAQEPRAPRQHSLAIEAHHGLIEQPILISQRGDDAAWMLGDHIADHFGIEFQEDQECMQRIVMQLPCPDLELVQHDLALRQIAFQQPAREIVLVLEMIEEATLRNTGCFDQLLDRRRGEALLNDRVICKVQQPLARLRPFAGRQLYRR